MGRALGTSDFGWHTCALYNTEFLKFSKVHMFIQFLLSNYYMPETMLTRGTNTKQRKCRQGEDGKEEGGDILPIVCWSID